MRILRILTSAANILPTLFLVMSRELAQGRQEDLAWLND
jgi:hypothetical protein